MINKVFIILLIITFKVYSIENFKIFMFQNNPENQFAITELSNYLKKITNKEIEIIYNGTLNQEVFLNKYIIIGNYSKNLEKLLKTDISLKDKESFIIKKINNSILIIGKTPLSTIYGTYTFLEKNIGIKFLSSKYEYLPKRITLLLKKDVEKPVFSYREIFMAEGDNPDFSLKLKNNGRFGHRNQLPLRFGNAFIKALDLYDLISLDEYGDSHPEYFCNDQLDFTLEEVKNLALKKLKEVIKFLNLSKRYYILISINDYDSYCSNYRNLKLIKQGGSPSVPYIDFISFIAENIKKDYPNITILASAYLWSLKPPKFHKKLPSNMGIFFAPIEADLSKPLNSKENKKFYDYLKGWTKISDNIFVWHYITNFNNYFQPFPNIYTIAYDLKTFSQIPQIKGVFLEGAYNTYGSDLSDMKLWIFSKLLWNPNQDVDKLITEFSDKFYGRASPYIKQYLKLLYSSIKRYPSPLYEKTPPNLPYLNLEFFIKSEKLFEKALKSVKYDKYFTEHVKKAKLGIDVMLLLNKGQLQEEAIKKNLSWFDKNYIKHLLKETEETVKREKIEYYSESGNIEDLLNILKLERKPSKAPKEVKGLEKYKNWFDFQEYTLTNCCGAEFEYDDLASDGVAVSLPGNTTDWGISFNLEYLPKGKWDIYFRIRVSLNDTNFVDRIKLAFRYGVYPVTRPYLGLINSYIDQKYHTVKVGTFERQNANLWIAPSGNKAVKKIYVDRVFIVKSHD